MTAESIITVPNNYLIVRLIKPYHANIISEEQRPNSIHEILLDIGISPSLSGYFYITYAIQLILANPDYLHSITKGLYIEVAKKYHTTPSGVERGIRHAVSAGWNNGNGAFQKQLFHHSITSWKNHPTNAQLLSRLYFFLESR